jgi:hypothetical protein
MSSKLSVFNDALAHFGGRKLASLSESVESRRALDDAWDDGVQYCLEQGLWNFAMRAARFDSSPSVEPAFGYSFAFTKPDDWVRTGVASANETLNPPMLGFADESGYWYANCDPFYVKYVSDDASYGFDVSLWPATFTEFVAAHLARKVCRRLNASATDFDRIIKLERRFKIDARSKDAMNESAAFPPQGTWVSSRGGGASRDRRSNASLMGDD